MSFFGVQENYLTVLKQIRDNLLGLGTGSTGGTSSITLNLDGVSQIKGSDGKDGLNGQNGLSAYEIWLGLGNVGTEQDFIDSLKGQNITITAYQIAVANGFEGTEQDWLISLKSKEITALNYTIYQGGTALVNQLFTTDKNIVVEVGIKNNGSFDGYLRPEINGVQSVYCELPAYSNNVVPFSFEVPAGSNWKITVSNIVYELIYLMEFEV